VLVRGISPGQANNNFAEIKINAQSAGKTVFADSIFAQVNAYVSGQVK
jgi:hypothetical protein